MYGFVLKRKQLLSDKSHSSSLDTSSHVNIEELWSSVPGEAAVPEGNSSGPQRAHMALSVWWEGQERAEPRKVSGQSSVSFSSSFFPSLFLVLLHTRQLSDVIFIPLFFDSWLRTLVCSTKHQI